MILTSISVILGNCCFPTYSTISSINLKENIPTGKETSFSSLGVSLLHPLGPGSHTTARAAQQTGRAGLSLPRQPR